MIEYTWNFPSLEVELSQNGLEKVVSVVHWRLTAKDGDYLTDIYGSVSLDPPQAMSFIAFDNLTEQDITSWVEAKLDVEQLKSSLETQINTMKHPTTITVPPPWN